MLCRMHAINRRYVKGLCWVLRYYYQGPPSWTWYYPHHYAPPASDLARAPLAAEAGNIVKFELGEPFLPLVQLTAVLPPLSSAALPPPLGAMMRGGDSPLAAAFPPELRLDLNGASASWKAVVLLPFLDASSLHSAFAGVQARLTPEEAARNRFGPNYVYVPPDGTRLAEEVWALAAAHAGKDGYAMARVAQPVSTDDGLAALLTPYPSPPQGARREPPSDRLPPVVSNRVASAVLRLPPSRTHLSVLLPGAAPPSTLHPREMPHSSAEEAHFARMLRG